MRGALISVLVVLTWVVSVYHLGTAPALNLSSTLSQFDQKFIPKSEYGIHQLILKGSPVERGLFAGEATKDILYKQEMSLQAELKKVIPSQFAQRVLFFGLMRWFWGIEKYLEPWMLEEMWGVSRATTPSLNYLSDPFTRQIAYHGLHEVGQSMVDANPESFGCTVVAIPKGGSWIIGRNFDFEGGRIFDEEKIMKWVYPKDGYAYLSVIWAGMVGAVTGVNENGVYISLNAAGTSDFKRLGTPSTLVLAKALQFSKNKEEAKKIIETAEMFITDIFVVADNHSEMLYRIEKSPKRVVTLEHYTPTAVTNHLVAKDWQADKINKMRREEMTSLERLERAEELLEYTNTNDSYKNLELKVLSFIRDKSKKGGVRLPNGNRAAIDGLIATHSVIWNGKENTLFVSQGPSLVGSFIGFNLKESFATKDVVRVNSLPADTEVLPEEYAKIKELGNIISEIKEKLKKRQFEEAKKQMDIALQMNVRNGTLDEILGDYYHFMKNRKKAKEYWQAALDFWPAYRSDRLNLQGKLNQ